MGGNVIPNEREESCLLILEGMHQGMSSCDLIAGSNKITTGFCGQAPDHKSRGSGNQLPLPQNGGIRMRNIIFN